MFGLFFSSLIIAYSIFVTDHSSHITYHLKYPNSLHKVCLTLLLNLLSLKYFYYFVGPMPDSLTAPNNSLSLSSLSFWSFLHWVVWRPPSTLFGRRRQAQQHHCLVQQRQDGSADSLQVLFGLRSAADHSQISNQGQNPHPALVAQPKSVMSFAASAMSSLMQEDSVQLALVGVTSSVIEEYDPARSSNPVKKKKPETQTQLKKKKEKEKKEKTPEIPTW